MNPGWFLIGALRFSPYLRRAAGDDPVIGQWPGTFDAPGYRPADCRSHLASEPPRTGIDKGKPVARRGRKATGLGSNPETSQPGRR
jgi:hypothetical protein